MFENIPAWIEYVLIGETTLIATLVFLWCVNRVQARRKRVGELAHKLSEWGLTKIAEPLDDYSHGDYSEVVKKFVALAKEMNTTSGSVALFESAVSKIVAYYAANNATKAEEMLDLLKAGTASKSLFDAVPAAVAAA
jgi:hypothetical protein